VRDMFAKENDACRAELRVARDERLRLEEALQKTQERQNESHAHPDPVEAQKAVVQAMQQDFEARVERYREEAKFLRQKCDEKEKRCEQLLAERSSLAIELRGSSVGAIQQGNDIGDDATGTGSDLEVGKPLSSKSGAGRQQIRSLPLAAPSWMRNCDEPLRLVVKTLAQFPQARLLAFTYCALLHVWVLFLLQQQAVQGFGTATSSNDKLPGAT